MTEKKKKAKENSPRHSFSLIFQPTAGQGQPSRKPETLEFVSGSVNTFTIWLDGFSHLLGMNRAAGVNWNQGTTARMVSRMADLEVKIRLMDLAAHEIKLPQDIATPRELQPQHDHEYVFDGPDLFGAYEVADDVNSGEQVVVSVSFE